MPHLTGLAALAATDSSADKTTTPVGFEAGISEWKDPLSALKQLPDIGTKLSENTEQSLGYLLIPVAAILLLTKLLGGRQ